MLGVKNGENGVNQLKREINNSVGIGSDFIEFLDDIGSIVKNDINNEVRDLVKSHNDWCRGIARD